MEKSCGNFMLELTSPVVLSERSLSAIQPAEWDAFVVACAGSFLGTWRVVRAHRLRSRVRAFEFTARDASGTPRKIGQCAVAIARGRVRFLDRLHLVPGFVESWDHCINLVIERCGAGTYEYGSPWNPEERRPPSNAVGALVPRLLREKAFFIDRVDFRRWRDFDAYRRDVSENIRRDYRKAVEASATVETKYGMAAIRDLVTLVRLRGEVMQRNGERFSGPLDATRHLLKLACIGDLAFITTVRTEGRCHAAFFGVEFGDDIYYLSGGTAKNSQGYGSYLFLTLIERWFATHPQGKLYLGRQSACVDPATYTRGNQLYRRKLRATSVSGAEFHVHVSRPAVTPVSSEAAPAAG
jgi:hypothetical protein